jgi:Tol biopolymer transport system component
MQFHARQNNGGTIISYDGKLKKVNMRNDSILSAGVYPAWHPWLNMIVYSTNKTAQRFHTVHSNKIEVYDAQSDLIAYDVETDEVTNLENDYTELEVFPAWAPDGKTLYYCSAHIEMSSPTSTVNAEVTRRPKNVKYNIYRKSFNPETMQFGPRELVLAADSMGMSATLPRISPDGRYLMFTMGEYGVFHIWHHDADLWMIDLQTGEAKPIEKINSPDTESYHSWSSNGRWVVYSSRRDDGTYTRPFFAHLDKNGKWSKPFELPQADPGYHRQFMKCYNIPEFMRGPVAIKPQDFADVLKRNGGEPVKYVRQLNK